MGKNSGKNKAPIVPIDMLRDAQSALSRALSKDVKYSIEPDPTGKLNLKDDQKNFLKAYIEFRNIPTAAQMAEIDESLAKKYFMDPTIRNELRRINLALYYRKFSRRLLTVDEIGGYLTSLLMDSDIGESDKLSSYEKIQVANLMMDLNKLKAESYKNPKIFENIEYEEHLQDLNPDQLKQLINATMSPSKSDKEAAAAIDKEKEALIEEITQTGFLDPSEIAYLKSCSIDELKKLKEGN